jgi:polyisoprenyl-phosphate glycosyltransferase
VVTVRHAPTHSPKTGASVRREVLSIVYIALKLAGAGFPVGNPTIVIVIAFFSGIQLLSLGVIGEYVGRIYDESRHRPKYIVESRYGFDEE